MTIKKRTKKTRLPRLSQRLKIITVVLFMVIGTYLLVQTQAAAGYIYISPATVSKYVGDTFSVQVRINTTSNINAAFVDMNYSANGLQVTSIQGGSHFPHQPEAPKHTISGNTGTIKMRRTRDVSSSGNLHYATITFRARTTGSHTITPLSSSLLVNYGASNPFVSYTVAGGRYAITTKPTPAPTPTPTPKPTPKPKPKPTPTPTPTPAPTTKPRVTVPKKESKPSASNLKISDFAISEPGYRSATLSWKTNKPASSKVNYGYTSSNMPHEITGQGKTTTHKLIVQGDTIRAGNQYAVRITSDDGAGPTTLDGAFSTRGIDILITVTDAQNQPIAGATVRASMIEAYTGDDGIARLTIPEGTVSISAQKDSLAGNLTAEITIPQSDATQPQQVSVALSPPSKAAAKNNQPGRRRSWLVLIPILFSSAGVIALVLFLRRKLHKPAYQGPSVTVLSEPTGETGVHHPTLPELVKQDLSAKRKKPLQPVEEPPDMFSVLDNPGQPNIPAPPPPQPPPMPQPTERQAPAESKPKSPHPHSEAPKVADTPKQHAPKPDDHPAKPHKAAEIDPKDNSLHINHDD